MGSRETTREPRTPCRSHARHPPGARGLFFCYTPHFHFSFSFSPGRGREQTAHPRQLTGVGLTLFFLPLKKMLARAAATAARGQAAPHIPAPTLPFARWFASSKGERGEEERRRRRRRCRSTPPPSSPPSPAPHTHQHRPAAVLVYFQSY